MLRFLRFIFNLIGTLLLRRGWTFPEFFIHPARLLHEQGLVMSTAFIGRQGVGKTFSLAIELLEQIKTHPEQSFFIFDWSGGLINTLYQLILSDPEREEIEPRLVYDPLGGREINGETYIIPMPEFSEEYDPEKPWLERAEDQVDRVQRIFKTLYQEEIVRNPTLVGRPIKNLLPNVLLLANAVFDENGDSWQITEVSKLLNKEVRELARKQFGGRVGKAHEYFP